jgi:type IV secretion system protein VirB10
MSPDKVGPPHKDDPPLELDEPAADDGAVNSVGAATVEGERDIPSVNRERSLQSRVNNGLALAVVCLVGGGFLFWYYSSTFKAQQDAKAKVEHARVAKAQGEMKLPPLGPVAGPRAASTDASVPPEEGPTLIGNVMGPPPPLGTTPPATAVAATPTGPQGPPLKTPAQLELDRKTTPSVLLRPNLQGAPIVGGATAGAGAPPTPLLGGAGGAQGSGASSIAGIGNYLTPTATPATSAQVLATRRFMIPKGNFADCTLETAISSQLPGLVTCISAVDIWGADGKVVLVEKGSKFVGESKGEARQGMNRLFVLWNEARTPTGVVVQLNSPATDALGRSGISGDVDTHFWQRFGAAIMISVIDGTVQALVQSQRSGNGQIIYNPQGSKDIMSEVLKNTIAIPPTITVNPGERIQIIVARDVDFRSVYELRMARTE